MAAASIVVKPCKESTPYTVFHRPYHLCHLETPRPQPQRRCMAKQSARTQRMGRVSDCCVCEEKDLPAGTTCGARSQQ